MNGWRAVTYEQIKEKAKLLGVSDKYAVGCRINYLKARLHEKAMEYAELAIWLSETDCPVFTGIWNDRADKLLKAIDNYRAQISSLRANERGKIDGDEITDAMIDRARSVPIPQLIELTRGKIRCINPEHEDKNPSAYYGTRTNRLCCPVCDTKMDAIDVYRAIHGVDFRQAVRGLQ